jgi:hypothetical protein
LVEKDLAPVAERKAINVEMKYFTRVSAEAALTPMLVTDREAILVFDDPTAHFRWGIQFQGRKTSTLFAQWYDELWASIPDRYLVGSRSGLNEAALDRIREELEAAEAVSDRRTA